jgi:hypothetical protein
MHRIRRPVALASAILFQLMLVVGAYGCAVPEGARAGALSMAGMSMPEGGERASPSAPDGGREAPCQLPATSHGCQSMAPCAAASIVPVSSEASLTGAPAPVAITALELLVPASVSLAPELPPPRA